MKRTIAVGTYTLTVLGDDPAAPILYTVADAIFAKVLYDVLPAPRPTLAIVDGADWKRDLSPWIAPGTSQSSDSFSGGADVFLHDLLTKSVPAAEEGLSPAWRGILGYSLCGLFALWAMTKTDAFTRCASVSGSLWFDNFTAYLSAHPLLGRPDRVYLSLGDREERTKDPRMQQVRKATEEAVRIIDSQGVPCVFELNPGGHFKDAADRQRKGILALLQVPGSQADS